MADPHSPYPDRQSEVAAEPVEASVSTHSEASIETPASTPAFAQSEAPAEPAERSALTLAEVSVETPASTPVEVPVSVVAETSALPSAVSGDPVSDSTLPEAVKSPIERLAHAISWMLHPFILPLYVIVVILSMTVFSLYPVPLKWYLVWVTVLYTIALPALSIGVLHSLGRISSWRIDHRRERLWPLAIGVVCYVLCALTFAKLPSVDFLRKFMLAAACCEALCLVVTFRWKISLHLTAMGAIVGLFVLLNVLGVGDMLWPLVVAILCSGLLASARLYLGCHNPLQVLVGFCAGFSVATLAMMFL